MTPFAERVVAVIITLGLPSPAIIPGQTVLLIITVTGIRIAVVISRFTPYIFIISAYTVVTHIITYSFIITVGTARAVYAGKSNGIILIGILTGDTLPRKSSKSYPCGSFQKEIYL